MRQPEERRALAATYRLQLHPGFGFDDAVEVLPYLAALGVSHVYCSPYLQAVPGSTHGYDVIDPSRVSDDLGGPDAHRRFCEALGAHGLGQVLDIVPNHLAASSGNPWWWDVLANGRASRYARHFDVEWAPTETKLTDRILLPVLGDVYGRVLEDGQLAVERDGGTFVVTYFEHRFPLSPRTADGILGTAALRAGSDDLAFLGHSLERLPLPSDDVQERYERHRDSEVVARTLALLCQRDPAVADAIDDVLDDLNADHDMLHALLERQNYRLAYWKTAAQELDYRRFFDISSLVGLRIEDPTVLRDVHGLVLGWLADGTLDGVRVDHPDGLRDPERYVHRLRDAAAEGAWIVVEKILTGDELLPDTWPVDGTTGYDFLNRVLWLFVDPEGLEALDALYRRYTGDESSFAELAAAAKREVLRTLLASDVERITNLLAQAVEQQRRVRDVARADLREVVIEVAASYDVYRTYVRVDDDGTPCVHDVDRDRIASAVASVAALRPDLDDELLAFVRAVLSLEVPGALEHAVALRFQQLTSPATAKGVEDTAFYRSTRLLALNEVGGEPDREGDALAAFHRHNALSAAHWPTTMLSTSTHDTKRSEDVRARLVLLSQRPDRWEAALVRLDGAADALGVAAPEPGVRWWVWQLLVGAHPIDAERAAGVVVKTLREAKLATSWLRPDEDYEQGVLTWLRAVQEAPAVAAALDAAVDDLDDDAHRTALAQTALKLTSPGVPDIYQGTELPDLSLVDPDNRRPVDYGRRAELLARLDGADAPAAWAARGDGLAKLWTTRQLLALRNRRPEAFGRGGTYAPLEARGAPGAVVAFTRGGPAGPSVVVVAPRVHHRPPGGRLPLPAGPSRWRNVLDGRELAAGEVDVEDLLARFPVAVLEGLPDAGERRVSALRVWAPRAERVDVVVGDGRTPMRPAGNGWFAVEAPPGAAEGYLFSLDGGPGRPDPRSPWQPHGIDRPSALVDPEQLRSTSTRWRGVHLPSSVVYELHVGTFSPEGTFDGAVAHLDHLVALGVDVVELMPVAEFPGERGWGYDGVQPFAPQSTYGGPAGLARLVEACHARGLGVLLDVVYNHLGPSGNHLGAFGPYFTDRYRTPWGDAVNVDGEGSDEVRRYVVDNACWWLETYHLDGLRLDAVHAITDMSARHLLEEMADEVEALAARIGRPLWLVAESDRNDPRLVRPREAGGYGLDAQWSDDLHHAIHTLLTGEQAGYYADFGTMAHLARALTAGWVYGRTYSPHRDRHHGADPTGLPGWRFVVCSQNHDQVGNRALGERLEHLAGTDAAKVAAALVLLSPFVPMLFQGEEWAASTPFLYFTDHTDHDLGEAVRQGRREEFKAFVQPDDVPDPQDPATAARSTLRWDELDAEPHRGMLAWYRALIALRRTHGGAAPLEGVEATVDEERRWIVLDRGRLVVAAVLGPEPAVVPVPAGRVVLASVPPGPRSAAGLELAPWSVVVIEPEA